MAPCAHLKLAMKVEDAQYWCAERLRLRHKSVCLCVAACPVLRPGPFPLYGLAIIDQHHHLA